MDVKIDNPEVQAAVDRLARGTRDAGGRALLVGGCVRDAALGMAVKDVDVEVYGIGPDRLIPLLSRWFALDLVGEAFGVVKLRGLAVDVAVPRRESKTGLGHKGFAVLSDPDMSPAEAASRRDYTVNSMAVDPLSGELIDPFDGMGDLRRRILRHTSGKFAEDPLRVLRGMQFVARFELVPASETVALCARIGPEGLAEERVFEEWRKLVVLGVRPSAGLAFLRATRWLSHYPELETMVGCRQDPAWHPEGDVWTHTLICMDSFARDRVGDAHEDLVVGLAVLCHDLGKPLTTFVEDGRIRSPGHSEAGEEPTRRFLGRMTRQRSLADDVVPLVREHLRPVDFFTQQAGDAAIRRLARRVGRIDRLVRVARADQGGKGDTAPVVFEAGEWLLARAQALAVKDSVPGPLVMGRHLLGLGLEPGPGFAPILEACYEAQLDGIITTLDEGLNFARGLCGERREAD
jgi:tRNA nucleotidyltransferase (CCA-adding enzyme)